LLCIISDIFFRAFSSIGIFSFISNTQSKYSLLKKKNAMERSWQKDIAKDYQNDYKFDLDTALFSFPSSSSSASSSCSIQKPTDH
jgi:hypothetical protein